MKKENENSAQGKRRILARDEQEDVNFDGPTMRPKEFLHSFLACLHACALAYCNVGRSVGRSPSWSVGPG